MPEDKLSNFNLNFVQLNSFELHIILTLVAAFSTTQDEKWMLQSCMRNTASVHDGEMNCAHSAVTEPTTLQSSASIFPQASCALLPSLFCGGSSASSCLGKRIQVKHDSWHDNCTIQYHGFGYIRATTCFSGSKLDE